MKQVELKKVEELLGYLFQNKRLPVWCYDSDLQLCYTNFTNPLLLHLMDVVSPMVSEFITCSPAVSMQLFTRFPYELYFIFSMDVERNKPYTAVIGPMLLLYPNESTWHSYSFHSVIWKEQKSQFLQLLTIGSLSSFLADVRFIMQTCSIKDPDLSPFCKDISVNYDTPSAFYSEEVCAYDKNPEILALEKKLWLHIKDGNMYVLDKLLQEPTTLAILFCGATFRDNYLYAISLLTLGRFAGVHGGLQPDTAFSIFFHQVHLLEKCRKLVDLYQVCNTALHKFTKEVQRISLFSRKEYSHAVNQCISLIMNRMPDKISLDELAESVHLSPKYLSCLFCKETGSSLTDFMQDVRIHEAKHLLKSTDLSYSEISNILDFSSQSYFTFTFKKKAGLTPKEYRHEKKLETDVTEDNSDLYEKIKVL